MQFLRGAIRLTISSQEDPVRNASLGFGKATKEMDIPQVHYCMPAVVVSGASHARVLLTLPAQILDPEDMVYNPNDHANMTYISLFRDWVRQHHVRHWSTLCF